MHIQWVKTVQSVQARAVSCAMNLDSKEAFSYRSFMDTLIDFSLTPQNRRENVACSETNQCAESSIFWRQSNLVKQLQYMNPCRLPSSPFCATPHHLRIVFFCATLHGGDRDTLGAMACAISGAYLGIESIPQSWRQKLENLSYIEDLALKLSEVRPVD